MYVLKELKNVVSITPDKFLIPRKDAITTELNKKLANKVSDSVTRKCHLYLTQNLLEFSKTCFLICNIYHPNMHSIFCIFKMHYHHILCMYENSKPMDHYN